MIALASYGSYSVYSTLQRGWVYIEGGEKASPEKYPTLYYLDVGFWLLTCPIFFVVGLVFLFSKKDLKKDSLEKNGGISKTNTSQAQTR